MIGGRGVDVRWGEASIKMMIENDRCSTSHTFDETSVGIRLPDFAYIQRDGRINLAKLVDSGLVEGFEDFIVGWTRFVDELDSYNVTERRVVTSGMGLELAKQGRQDANGLITVMLRVEEVRRVGSS